MVINRHQYSSFAMMVYGRDDIVPEDLSVFTFGNARLDNGHT